MIVPTQIFIIHAFLSQSISRLGLSHQVQPYTGTLRILMLTKPPHFSTRETNSGLPTCFRSLKHTVCKKLISFSKTRSSTMLYGAFTIPIGYCSVHQILRERDSVRYTSSTEQRSHSKAFAMKVSLRID